MTATPKHVKPTRKHFGPFDFDGDGGSEIVLRDVSAGARGASRYLIGDGINMREEIFGLNQNMAAPAAFSEDGLTQLAAVSRSSDGQGILWSIRNVDGSSRSVRFGVAGDRALSNCRFMQGAGATLSILRKGSSATSLHYKLPEQRRFRTLKLSGFKEVYRASCGPVTGSSVDALIIHGSKEVRGVISDVLAAIDPSTRKVVFSRKMKRNAVRGLLTADISGSGIPAIGVVKRQIRGKQIVDFFSSPTIHVPVTLEAFSEITAASSGASDDNLCDALVYRTKANQLRRFNLCQLVPETLAEIGAIQAPEKIRLIPSVNTRLFRKK